jgi:hypothetical protein
MEEKLQTAIALLTEILSSISVQKEKPPAEKEKVTKEEKRIPRMTKRIEEFLIAAMKKVGAVYDEKKTKQEYKAFIDRLSESQWKDNSDHEDRTREFAKSKKPNGGAGYDIAAERALESKPPVKETVHTVLSHAELKKITKLSPMDDPAKYFDGSTGKFITGPLEDNDEDMTEPQEFEGKTYSIGETTGRVYLVTDDEPDKFVGFAGVGKFKNFDI